MIRKIITVLALCLTLGVTNIASAVQYPDVQPQDDFYEEITTLSNMGILFGYPDGYYRPLDTMTRAEFASIVVRALNLIDKPYEEKEYKDLDKGHWAYKYLQLATFYDLIKCDTNGEIYPNDPVTRIDVISIIANALDLGEITQENAQKLLEEYEDYEHVPAWLRANVALSLNYDLVVSPPKGAGYIAPLDNAIRAEVAGFIARLMAAYEEMPAPKLTDAKYGIKLYRGDVIGEAYKDGRYTIIPAGVNIPLAIIECSIQNPLKNGMDFRAKVRKNYITKDNRVIFPANTEFYGKFVDVQQSRKLFKNEKIILQTHYYVNSKTGFQDKIMMTAIVEPKYKGKNIVDKVDHYLIRGKKSLVHKSSTGNFILLEPYKIELVDEYVKL